MRKRLLLYVVAIATIACVVVLSLAMMPPQPGVTKANFDRIKVGMSRNEVQKIFGDASLDPGIGYVTSSKRIGQRWGRNDETFAIVVFDPWQHVVVMDTEWRDYRVTLAQRIRCWLRLP